MSHSSSDAPDSGAMSHMESGQRPASISEPARLGTLVDLAQQAFGGPSVSLTIMSPDDGRHWIGEGLAGLEDACRQRVVASIETIEPQQISTDVLHLGDDRPPLRWVAVGVTGHGALVVCDEEPWTPDEAAINLMTGFAGLIEQELQRLIDADSVRQLQSANQLDHRIATMIATSSRDGVIGLDASGDSTFVNSAAAVMLGQPADDLIGKPAFEWFSTSSQGEPDELDLRSAFANGESIETVDAILHLSNGGEVPVELSLMINTEQDGRITGAVIRFGDLREIEAAQAATRQSEERQKAFLDMTPDSIITLDNHGRIIEFNRAAERTFRTEAVSIISRPFADTLIAGSQREWFHSAFETFRTTGDGPLTSRHVEVECQRLDGSTFPAELTVTRLTTSVEQLQTIYLRDLTFEQWNERRRSTRYAVTETLAETESPDDAIPRVLEIICQGLEWDWAAFWTRSPGSNEMRIEATWRRDGLDAGPLEIASRTNAIWPGYGVLGDVWVRRRAAWIVDVETTDAYRRAEAALACGFRTFAALPVVGRNDVIGVVEVLSQQVREEDSEMLRMFDSLGSQIGQYVARKRIEEERVQLLVREHTARTEAEAAERRLAFLLDASALFAASLDYEETLANVARLSVPKLADYCAIDMQDEEDNIQSLEIADVDPNKEKIDRDLQSRYPIDPDSDHPVAQVMRSGRALLFSEVDDDVIRLFDPNEGEFFHAIRELGVDSAMYVPLLARNRTLGVVSFVSSESGRTYGSADLALAQVLARRAALAIDNALLYREARDAVRAREEFLSIASHELRTPLTTVKGYSQILARLLRRDPVDHERVVSLADRLQDQLVRFETLIADLLDISRIQQGRLELRPEPTDLVELVQHVLFRFYDPEEPGGWHQFRIEGPESCHGIWDPDRLDQVLTNLISNAVKYSPEGGEILIRITEEDDQVLISVTDPGIGIPKAEQSKLFRPFARSETVQRAISGVGLGLYISSEIVERHGGTITLKSRPGSGSTFTVALPRHVAGDSPDDNHSFQASG